MLKNIIKSGFIGIAISITISLIMALVISLIMYGTGNSHGQFYYVVPKFTQLIGNESFAALITFAACVVYGFIVGAISSIWKMDHLGLTIKTIIHYFALILLLPMAVALQWVPFNVINILIFVAIFTVIYILIWLIEFLVIKHNVKKINTKL